MTQKAIVQFSTPITYQELFLDYFNNYLTVEKFADDYGFTVRRAQEIIDVGRNAHEAQFEGTA